MARLAGPKHAEAAVLAYKKPAGPAQQHNLPATSGQTIEFCVPTDAAANQPQATSCMPCMFKGRNYFLTDIRLCPDTRAAMPRLDRSSPSCCVAQCWRSSQHLLEPL